MGMTHKELEEKLQKFDPELSGWVQRSFDRQITSLSLIATDSAASPLTQYLKGSALGNDFDGHNPLTHHSHIEELATERIRALFGAENAIIRTANVAAASRVVLLTLVKPGETVLSFNLRKQKYCRGSHMKFNFVKFALEPDTLTLNIQKLRYLAMRHKPVLIVCSATNYPKNINYRELRSAADECGAKLWVDLNQNAGLIAAKLIESPVPYADVVTFSTGDALHGPHNGIILSKKDLADPLKQVLIDSGYSSVKKNVFAALAITVKEVSCEEYKDFAHQVLDNARALEDGLKGAGVDVLSSPTENHLVVVRLTRNQDGATVAKKLEKGGLLVKAETLMTSDDRINYPILRLSSLDPTTRSLGTDDMFTIGMALGEFLNSPQDEHAIGAIKMIIQEMVENLPLFSEDWLPESEIVHEQDNALMMKAMIYGM